MMIVPKLTHLFVFVVWIAAREAEGLGQHWRCQSVLRGFHRAFPPIYGFNRRSTPSYEFRFEELHPYDLGSDCQSDWNKLWGQSRCGFLRHHHRDSDRFVWRPHAGGGIEIAAYSYDGGDKPFQNQNRLLKPFRTIVQPGDEIKSKMDLSQNATLFTLTASNGTDERILVEHPNECAKYRFGYKLFLYFGGNCRAPDKVKVCYR